MGFALTMAFGIVIGMLDHSQLAFAKNPAGNASLHTHTGKD
jgi:hypothetical protein